MTQSDRQPSQIARVVITGALLLGVLFSAGVLTGFTLKMIEHGHPSIKSVLVGLAILALLGLLGWLLARQIKLAHWLPNERLSPRERKLRRMWILVLGIGGLIGAGLGLASSLGHTGGASFQLLANTPIPSGVAALLLALLALSTLFTVWYYRMIDEHELAAQAYASTVTFNLYLPLTLAWWVAARGQLAPPVDAMQVFLATVCIWTAVWLWRRYR